MNWLVRVTVMLKPQTHDAQGTVVQNALNYLVTKGMTINKVRMGKHIKFELEGPDDKVAAEEEVVRLCRELLANMVIESFTFMVSKPPKQPKKKISAPSMP